jgi:hypothetical protein
MTLVTQDPAPPTPRGDTQILFREARQRRRRRQRRIVTLVALVLAVAMTAIAFSTRRAPTPTSATKSTVAPSPFAVLPDTGATLVYALNDLRFIKADSGQTSARPLPTLAGGASDLSMLRVGGSFILNRGDTAWLYRSGNVGAPINLGPSLRVIPGPSAGEVWLWGNSPFGSAANGYVRLVNFSGEQMGSRVDLPSGWVPSGGAVDGAIVLFRPIPPSGTSGIPYLEVWNPLSGRVIRSFDNATEVAANGETLAWQTARNCKPHCVLHLTNLRTGAQHSLPMPHGTTPGPASFSPDGRTLALAVWFNLAQPPRLSRTAVAIINVASGTIVLLPGSEQTFVNPDPGTPGTFAPTWSQDSWVFFTAYASRHILTWHEGRPMAVVLSHARLPHLSPLGAVPSMIAS